MAPPDVVGPLVERFDGQPDAYRSGRYPETQLREESLNPFFDALAAYDYRIHPVKTDKAATARIMYHQYTHSADCWDELAGLFSPKHANAGREGGGPRIECQIRSCSPADVGA